MAAAGVGRDARFYDLAPVVALVLLVVAQVLPMAAWLAVVLAIGLGSAVFATVHHAEVVAHRVGEPYGTLVLALAVTVVEVALIVSLLRSGGQGAAAIARDTVFATVMIICNGVVGLCLVLGGLRHHEQAFRVAGVNASLATLVVLAALTLVVPVFTTTTHGPTYSTAQDIFVAIASLTLWLTFVFAQTRRHRDYFLPELPKPAASEAAPSDTAADLIEEQHAPPPPLAMARRSGLLMVVALVAVVGLAKSLSPVIEGAVAALGAPKAMIGIVVAMVVLLPETVAAVRAARANRLQTSMNLAFGSALASIGLTIPIVVIAALLLDVDLVLGVDATSMALMVLTFLVTSVTLGRGVTNVMQGAVHLVLFATYLFFSYVP